MSVSDLIGVDVIVTGASSGALDQFKGGLLYWMGLMVRCDGDGVTLRAPIVGYCPARPIDGIETVSQWGYLVARTNGDVTIHDASRVVRWLECWSRPKWSLRYYGPLDGSQPQPDASPQEGAAHIFRPKS